MNHVQRASAALACMLVWTCNASPLTAGSDAPKCQSMLHPGAMTKCDVKSNADEERNPLLPQLPVAQTAKTNRSSLSTDVTEQDIDDFLTNYGKPPRAAVKALLSPTDENIASMAAEETRRQVIASYVAQRWTELQQGPRLMRSDSTTVDAYRTLPLLLGLRLQLIVTPQCKKCEMAATNLKRLLEENPVLDAKIIVVTQDDGDTLATLLNIGASVPVQALTEVEAKSLGWESFPIVEVKDMKTQSRKMIVNDLSAVNMKKVLLSMRKVPSTTAEAKK